MANKKQNTMELQVREFLKKKKMISAGIAREKFGIVPGTFRSIIYNLRNEGWSIELDPSACPSAYRLVSMPDSPVPRQPVPSAFPIPILPYRTYTPAEFRKMLIALYGEMENWQLAAIAMKDFNTSHRQVYRWLTGKSAISGPAIPLADMLTEKHNAKTEGKP